MRCDAEWQREIAAFLEAVNARYGYDLRGYHLDSMERRVLVALARSGSATLGELRERVVADPESFARVLDYLTIRVSDMFRDPGFYRVFAARVLPALRTYPLLRIWHAGCACGEEAYATAILLTEAGLYDRCQIYATDLSPTAIDSARRGMFAIDRLPSFTRNYLEAGGARSFSSYYTSGYGQFEMRASLAKNILFFQHDLVGDHVFGEMHVVFCRNVLIYFAPELRRRVLAKLGQSLRPGGFLCLGSSEQLWRSNGEHAFRAVDPAARIYQQAFDRQRPAEVL